MASFDAEINEISKELGLDIRLVERSFASVGKAESSPVSTTLVPAKDAIIDIPIPAMLFSPQNKKQRKDSTRQVHLTRSELWSHVTKWTSIMPPRNTEKDIRLVGKDSFSHTFESAIGSANVTNVYLHDDLHGFIDFFMGLLEQEASRQLYVKHNRHLEALLNIHEGWTRDSMRVSGELSVGGTLSWSISHGAVGKGWTNLLCTLFNLSRLDAIATLAKFLGMNFENLYQLSSDKHVAELNGSSASFNDHVPREIRLPPHAAGSACAELVQVLKMRGNAGQVIGAIAVYSMGGNTFCLPATVGRGELSLGCYKPTAHFLNQHLMDEHPHAVIVFCQDMRTALALQRFLDEIRGYTPAEIIVTAHLGEDLSVLPWHYLYGHDVVFIYAPTKKCMAMVRAYEAHVRGAMAKSFSIHLGFLLHSPAGCDLACAMAGVTEAEGELLRLAKVLDDEIQPMALLRRVIKGAVPYSQFKAWGQALGIFKANQDMVPKSTSVDKKLTLPDPNPALIPAPAYSLSNLTIYHTMRPGNYVMLLGAKGAGKTQLALSSCGALLKGNVQWPLFSGQVMNAGNVTYVDAETPYDEYGVNLEQHGLAPELGHRFFGLSKFAPDLPEFCNTFSLADKNFRNGLFRYLLQHQCRFVFLDNLAALMGDMVDHGKSAKDVLDWVEKLQKAGLCVILVHHKAGYEATSPNTDKARGSQFFGIRARTIIALQGKIEILNNRLGTEAVQAKAGLDGLTVGLRFAASKTAPVLECKTLWLYLPLGVAQWEFLALTGVDGKEIELPHDYYAPEVKFADTPLAGLHPDDGTEGVPCSPELLADCTGEERQVYDFITKHGNVKNAKIQKILNCRSTKAGVILSSLTAKKLIKREGRGPAIGYSLR